MTLAQSSESAHQSSGSARLNQQGLEHNAPNEASNMSNPGPEEPSSITSSPKTVLALDFPGSYLHDASTQTESEQDTTSTRERGVELLAIPASPIVKVSDRVWIVDLVQQLRHERYLENRVQLLNQRKKILRRTISLSARLHRVQFVAREGLTEITERRDPALSFKTVLQFTQELVHSCYTRWNAELHALDPLEISDHTLQEVQEEVPAGPRLSNDSQTDVLVLLNKLRSNSSYLLHRMKALSAAQLQGLSQTPSFERHGTSALGSMGPSTRKSQQLRLQDFANKLQRYVMSLERTNPWSFLLFNIYGSESSLQGPEHCLRLSTWSTILADLYVTYEAGFHALAPLLLDSFAVVQDWHARERVELQLMDILQQGAFLLSSTSNGTSANPTTPNPAHTPEAQSLFTTAATELLWLFSTCDGGFPPGAIQFISAVLAKLPTEEQQMGFRGYCFSTWFVGRYLRQAITFPETESMLHNFHISHTARRRILLPLWDRLNEAVNDVFRVEPLQPVGELLRNSVYDIIYALKATSIASPYPLEGAETAHATEDSPIFICVSEVIRILDALSPQFQHGPTHDTFFLEASRQSFQAQYAQNSFNRLREELLNLQEPTTSTSDTHPCDEQWMEFRISPDGQLQDALTTDKIRLPAADMVDHDLNQVQRASLRLCNTSTTAALSFEGSTSYRADKISKQPLRTLFQSMIRSPKVQVDSVSRMFWEAASQSLSKSFPICDLTGDDSTILRPLIVRSKALQSRHIADCARLEAEVSVLEDVSSKIKYATMTMMEQGEDLKFKLWYLTSVQTSKSYADAKNISEALTNMALLGTPTIAAGSSSGDSVTRPSSSRSSMSQSTTSSIFQQPMDATLVMLKARAEHGGPKKLSDEQILLTENWLREANVENFCTGEERIHRFCMEVSSTAKAIISDSNDRSASPLLWCNVLFSNDESYRSGILSAPASIRAASVSSDGYMTGLRPSRPINRVNQPARAVFREEQASPVPKTHGHSSWSSPLDRDNTQADPVFTVGSPGRAYSTTTTESISTFWSPQPSNPRSLTSVSAYSRPPSMYDGGSGNRFHETWQEKAETLKVLRHKLLCLLLSDLGCAVWSSGCETDAWLHRIREDVDVARKLERWTTMENLVSKPVSTSDQTQPHRPVLQRRESNPTPCSSNNKTNKSFAIASESLIDMDKTAVMALEELLIKMRSQVDPKKKLQAVEEFHRISVQQINQSKRQGATVLQQTDKSSAQRRNSVDAPDRYHGGQQTSELFEKHEADSAPTESQIIHQLKVNIKALKPSTLFRDLQYIAAMLPQDLSNKTAGAEAVLRMGLAALAYKDEMCTSMVTVADKLVAKDSIKCLSFVDPIETTIKRASEFWMFAAREGNAVAQRELGMLYLSHPHSIPILTYPLWPASKVFQHDVPWMGHSEAPASRTSLCLAFHWMKMAADNGDQVAEKRLAERQASISLR